MPIFYRKTFITNDPSGRERREETETFLFGKLFRTVIPQIYFH